MEQQGDPQHGAQRAQPRPGARPRTQTLHSRSRVGRVGDAGRGAQEGEDAVRMRGRARDRALLRTQPDHIQRPPKFGARLVGRNTRRQSWTRPRKLRRVHNLIIKYYSDAVRDGDREEFNELVLPDK